MPTITVTGDATERQVIELVRQDIAKVVETKARRFIVAADSNLVRATPVDTGQARRNWLPSLITPQTSPIFFADGKTDPSGAASIQQAERAASGFKIGLTAYITNNLPYINRLNNGWSGQQPTPGWIQRTVDATARAIFGGDLR